MPIALMLALVGVSVWQMWVLIGTAESVERSDATIADANAAAREVIDMETGLRGYRLTYDRDFLQPYTRAVARVDAALGALAEASAGHAEQVARAERLRSEVAAWREFAAGVLRRIDAAAEDPAAAPKFNLERARQGKARMDGIRALFDEFIRAEERQRDTRAKAARLAAWRTVVAAVGLTAAAAALLAWFGRRQLDSVGDTYRAAVETAEARAAEVGRLNETLEARVAKRTAALSDERSFLSAVLDNVTNGIAACGSDGRITLFNAAMTSQLQREAQSVDPEQIGATYNCYEPDGKTPLPPDRVPLVRAWRGEVVRDAEIVVVPPGAAPRTLLCSGRSFFDEAGELLGAVVSTHDVTELKDTERRLRASIEELGRSNRELQDFASVASHDLQEPLRKIQAFGDRLKVKCADQLSDVGRDYLERMQAAAGRMSTLIEDLLTFSRVTTRAQPFEEVDLNDVLREVSEDLENHVDRAGGRIDVGRLPAVEGDATQLRQLFQNLINNGLKFHAADRPPVVTVRAVGDGIEVSDNGIGFDEKYLDRIFNIFQRLHTRGEYEGTGIGLAVCRKIAERHGGALNARSRPGEGATFTLTLPSGGTDVSSHSSAQEEAVT